MKIWLATIGEPVPTGDNVRDRLHRTGYFAHFLADHGHDVVWWTSTFDHFRKKHHFDDDHTLRINDHLEIRLLHGCGYQSNVSLSRFRDHAQIGRKFARYAAEAKEKPDVIVAALPTIELCLESARYGLENHIPVVLDMRDMWPDIFATALPKPARPLARMLFWPMFRSARKACSQATAIIGITDAFVDWGLKRGGRRRGPLDRAFAMGYTSVSPSPEKLQEAEKYWDSRQVTDNPATPIACFIGTLGRQFDLETVLKAVSKLQESGNPLRFAICGSGDRLEHYKNLAAGLSNVTFPGWVDAAQIHVLMRRSTFGLDPMPDRYDFLATINNKAIEYLSAGLPVISSPARGVLAELLAKEQCGLSYEIGDAEELATILQRLSNSPDELQKLRQNSKRLFDERFAAERVYGDMMAYLEEIVAAKKA